VVRKEPGGAKIRRRGDADQDYYSVHLVGDLYESVGRRNPLCDGADAQPETVRVGYRDVALDGALRATLPYFEIVALHRRVTAPPPPPRRPL
jgi:hypothetical protein